MKVLVDGIPQAGREIVFGLAEGWARESATTSLDREPTRLAGSITLTKATTGAGVVIVDVKAVTGSPAACDRCGEECDLTVETEIRLLYAPEESAGAAFDGMSMEAIHATRASPDGDARSGVELNPEDLDLGWYSKGELVLGDVLCEALSLATPPRVVCTDVAGCDKRTDALLAVARVADGPFAVLGALKRPTIAED